MTTGGAAPMSQPPAAAGTVEQRMAKGALWMVLARIVDRSIGLVSTIILARLLVPADFGLVAMATALLALLELLGTFGFDLALIQNPNATRRHYDTAWTFNVLLGSVVALGLVLLAAPAAHFYAEPRLRPVVLCLSLAALVQGFENIGVVAFRKELTFDKEFRLLFLKKIAAFAVTIPLAFTLRTYWALVAGIVVGRFVSVGLTYWVQEFRPKFSLAARGELFHFGKWLVVGGILNFVSSRCADFLVGKISGPRALGLFNISYEISNLPTSDLIAPINRAIFPGYARKAADLNTLRLTYFEVIGVIAVLAIPAGVGIAAVAQYLVPVVLGAKWVDAVPSVVALSFYGILLALKSNNHYVYLAIGRPRIASFLGVTQLVILLPAVAAGASRGGANGAALGYLAAQLLFSPISVAVLRRTLQLRMTDLAAVFYRPMLAAAIMYGALALLVKQFGSLPTYGAAMVLPLLTCVACGAVTYVAVLFALWALAGRPVSAERRVLDFIGAKLGRGPGIAIGRN